MSTTTEQPATNGNALARINTKAPVTAPQLRTLLSQQMPDLESQYGPTMKAAAARLARAVLTEFQKSPDLARCTAESLLSCVVQAAQLNLEIGGPTGQSFMVPYKGEATYQLGYRGMITLAHRSGRVAAVTAVCVKDGDEFEVQMGTNPGIDHRPGKTRGVTTHVYAVVTYKQGGIDFEVMSVGEVDAHRRQYSMMGGKGGPAKGIWASAPDAMALKTVIRRLLKRVPIGVDAVLSQLPGEVEVAAEIADRPAPRQIAAEPDLENLMAQKGLSPGEACAWLNEQFGVVNGYDELPPVDDLPPAHKTALAEYLAGLPDAPSQ